MSDAPVNYLVRLDTPGGRGDIYYCHDCGDEFSEPCIRHEGVDHE